MEDSSSSSSRINKRERDAGCLTSCVFEEVIEEDEEVEEGDDDDDDDADERQKKKQRIVSTSDVQFLSSCSCTLSKTDGITSSNSANPLRLEVIHHVMIKLEGMESYVELQQERARLTAQQLAQQEKMLVLQHKTLVQQEKMLALQRKMLVQKEKMSSWKSEVNRLKLCHEFYVKAKNDVKAQAFLTQYEELLVRGPLLDEGYI